MYGNCIKLEHQKDSISDCKHLNLYDIVDTGDQRSEHVSFGPNIDVRDAAWISGLNAEFIIQRT